MLKDHIHLYEKDYIVKFSILKGQFPLWHHTFSPPDMNIQNKSVQNDRTEEKKAIQLFDMPLLKTLINIS